MFLIKRSNPVVAPSYIHQLMKIGVQDIMYKISQHLEDIVKPLVQNEIQKAREEELHHHGQLEVSANSLHRIQPCFGHWTYDRH